MDNLQTILGALQNAKPFIEDYGTLKAFVDDNPSWVLSWSLDGCDTAKDIVNYVRYYYEKWLRGCNQGAAAGPGPGSERAIGVKGEADLSVSSPAMLGLFRKYVGFIKGTDGVKESVVAVLPTCLATYAHGQHSGWQTGDKIQVEMPSGQDATGFQSVETVVCQVDRNSDFVLLHIPGDDQVEAPLLTLAQQGETYCLCGPSSPGLDQAAACHGKILDTRIDKHGHIYGGVYTGAGDSGGAVFSCTSRKLVAMAVALDKDRNAWALVSSIILYDRYKCLGIGPPEEDEQDAAPLGE